MKPWIKQTEPCEGKVFEVMRITFAGFLRGGKCIDVKQGWGTESNKSFEKKELNRIE